MNEIQTIRDSILKTINLTIEQYLKKLKYDITVKGIVKEVLNDNKYKVGVLGSEYIIECEEKSFKKYESVYVLIPQNNYNEMIILSSESGQNTTGQVNIGDIPDLENILNGLSGSLKKLSIQIENGILLKSSDENNKIKINEDNTMSINKVTTDKLTDGQGIFVINGGNSGD